MTLKLQASSSIKVHQPSLVPADLGTAPNSWDSDTLLLESMHLSVGEWEIVGAIQPNLKRLSSPRS